MIPTPKKKSSTVWEGVGRMLGTGKKKCEYEQIFQENNKIFQDSSAK